MQIAAERDLRPNIPGKYRIKFKAEALPLRDKIGGFRMLFSHNVQCGLSQAPEGDRTSLAALAHAFPALSAFKKFDTEKVELVNRTFVEEIPQDLGVLDFGKGIEAKANAALWRSRGDHRPLVGEFSFPCKFQRRDELHARAMKRCEQFFTSLQALGSDWVALGTTKTGTVYRLNGNSPQSHE
jgi:hypothetical protein